MLTRFAALIGLFAFAMVARPASGAVELTELLAPGTSFDVDSLQFDQFTFTADGLMPSPSGVQVDAVTDADGNVGIRVTGGFSDTPDTEGPSTLQLGYRVSTTDGSIISGATLAGNPAIVGQGSVTITETASDFEMSLVIFDSSMNGTDLLESISLDGDYSSLDVLLSLEAEAIDGAGTASFVDQTFAQMDGDNNVIPEPASIAIWIGTLALGMIGMRWFQR